MKIYDSGLYILFIVMFLIVIFTAISVSSLQSRVNKQEQYIQTLIELDC
jgi:hypothetical protein